MCLVSKQLLFYTTICIAFLSSCAPLEEEVNIPVTPHVSIEGLSTTFDSSLTDSIHPFQSEELTILVSNPRGLEFIYFSLSYTSDIPIIIRESNTKKRLSIDSFPSRGIHSIEINCNIPITKIENSIQFQLRTTDLYNNTIDQTIHLNITESILKITEYTSDTLVQFGSETYGVLVQPFRKILADTGRKQYEQFQFVYDSNTPFKFYSPNSEIGSQKLNDIQFGDFNYSNTQFTFSNITLSEAKALENSKSIQELFLIYPENSTSVTQTLNTGDCVYYKTELSQYGVICLEQKNGSNSLFYIK